MKLLLGLLLSLSVTFCAHASNSSFIELGDHNTVIMNKPFNSKSVAEVQQKLRKLSSLSNKDLYLVLDSPGGSIDAGQSLIDFAKGLPNKVHTITLFAASMAYLTAQHLDNRYVVSGAKLMSHRARISGLGGQVPGEANTRLAHITKIVSELLETTAKRVGVSYDDYLHLIYDELWLTGAEAVAKNHADAIVSVKCDDSLKGTYDSQVRTFFGTFKVTYSKCPMIRGPVKIDADNEEDRQLVEDELDYESYDQFKYIF